MGVISTASEGTGGKTPFVCAPRGRTKRPIRKTSCCLCMVFSPQLCGLFCILRKIIHFHKSEILDGFSNDYSAYAHFLSKTFLDVFVLKTERSKVPRCMGSIVWPFELSPIVRSIKDEMEDCVPKSEHSSAKAEPAPSFALFPGCERKNATPETARTCFVATVLQTESKQAYSRVCSHFECRSIKRAQAD